ncbi:ATP-grasp domain-containing protein [Methylopila henanensis]|uniref:ATP-grasp domain-containing protein n=1 Tax=Methylopila henanensis TaxID=873516 RepID=A0ABW4K0F3_9HYPH
MRVLLCEFVTGGGMHGNPLPASLAREGLLMRDALARDLAELGDVALTTTADPRLPAPPAGRVATLGEADDPWRLWADLAAEADLLIAVAPETGGLLARLAALGHQAGAQVFGPDDETIRITTSKRETATRLRAAGVATPPAWPADAIPSDAQGPFVTKPDDGAGCEDTRYWLDRPLPGAVPADHIALPFVEGDAASLFVARGGDGGAVILSANRQLVTVEDGAFRFRGLDVGALDRERPDLVAVAQAVADALPGLDGLFGIDLALGAHGPVVIEVNPRPTTAYAGLRQALGLNPLRLVAPFADAAPPARAATRPVELRL